ncbi:MAG: response regulator transcription factor [Phycisphaeraceae bacterium]
MNTSRTATVPDKDTARVFVLDNQPVIHAGLTALIEGRDDLCVCGAACSIHDAMTELQRHTPDALVMGLCFAEHSCLDMIREIRRRWPAMGILVLAGYDETVFAERVLRAGANGYIMTSRPPEEVLAALSQVLSGKTYLSAPVASGIIQSALHPHNGRSALAHLSDREMEVFEMIGRGRSMRDIARVFSRSIKTIETHREHIKIKLGLTCSRELTQNAAQWLMGERGRQWEPEDSRRMRDIGV